MSTAIDKMIMKVDAAPTVKDGVDELLKALTNEAHTITDAMKAEALKAEAAAGPVWIKLQNELHILFAEAKSKAHDIAVALEANLK